MHLAFDIFQGMGIAVAVGIRPFLPALVTGALASGDVQIDFKGTDYSFLESTPFLLGMAVGVIAVALTERRLGPKAADRGPFAYALLLAAVVLAALFFAGALAQHRDPAWPGWCAGAVLALVGFAATRPLLARVRARLDKQAADATILYAESAALLIGAFSVLLPPVGLLAAVALLWLLLASRRRADQKYAGLRILR